MLKGHVFKEQVFRSEVFAYFVDIFLGGKCGVGSYGNNMEVTHNGTNVTIQDGLVCIKGRFLEEDTYTMLNAGNDTCFCKLVIEIDLDKENTQEVLNQASYKIIKAVDSFPNLTQTDIVKNNKGIYQYELARFKTGLNGITDFEDTRTYLDFNSIYAEIENKFKELDLEVKEQYKALLEELKNKLATVEDGSEYLLKDNIAVFNNPSSVNFITYPTGFNNKNTLILSAMVDDKDNMSVGLDYSVSVELASSGINVFIEDGNNTVSNNNLYYKIALMKI